jgi:hypothetical protein
VPDGYIAADADLLRSCPTARGRGSRNLTDLLAAAQPPDGQPQTTLASVTHLLHVVSSLTPCCVDL